MGSNATSDRRFFEAKVPPVIWGAIAVGLVFGVAELSIDAVLLSAWSQLVAVACALGGIGIALAAVGDFGKAGTTVNPHAVTKASSLVTTGPFRFSRNPMYLGMLLVVIGSGFWFDSLLALLVGAAFFVGIMTVAQIRPEERTMRLLFGDEYQAWSKRVRRWI